MMTINERIVKLMKERNGMNQTVLGKTIGVSVSTVNNWLSLGRSIPAEYIKPIADCLGVSCEYILTGDDENMSEENADWLSLINRLSSSSKKFFYDELTGYLSVTTKKIDH